MIIMGYQGIGKTTLVENVGLPFVELGGDFYINGEMWKYWCESTTKMAKRFNEQGLHIFIYFRTDILLHLKDAVDLNQLLIVHPALNLREQWIQKLKNRWETTKQNTDKGTWETAIRSYEWVYNAIKNSGVKRIELKSMDYNLRDLLYKEGVF